MKLQCFVVITVLVLGILLTGHVAVGDTSTQDLQKALEDALKIIKQIQANSTEEKSDNMWEATQNLTTAIQELTIAVINNTVVLKSAVEGNWLIDGRVKCDPPFFPLKFECFYVNRYRRASWSESRNFCRGLGGDLAQPSDVNTLRATLLDEFHEDPYKFFWIGATESGSEGNYAWLESRPVDREDWATGQPDGGNENCVVLSRDEFPSLHDSPCYTHALFICEKVPLPSTQ